jgi:hypothetical protein
MQLAPAGAVDLGKKVFPAWSAAVTLVKDNGVDAASWATQAVKSKDLSQRLDFAVRTMTSLDHAIDASKQLPVSWLVKGVGAYYRGYDAAKQAVTLLLASNLVPAAGAKVGLQTLFAAKDEFARGVAGSGTDRSRYAGHLGNGWVSASFEDALNGLVMLHDQTVARPLVSGIEQVRQLVEKRKPVDPALVANINELFDRATGSLLQQITRQLASGTPVDPAALRMLDVKTSALLTQAGETGLELVRDMPTAAQIDRIAASQQRG